MKRDALVTGANGYLGAHLVRKLSESGAHVWALVRSPESDIRPLQGLKNVDIIFCPLEDIQKLSRMIPRGTVDVCYHLAWNYGKKLKNKKTTDQVKLVESSIRLLDAVCHLECGKFIGTGSILETNAGLPLINHPNVVYAVTKDCANKLLQLRAKEFGMQYCWCRLCSIYGGKDETGNLVSYTISKLKAGESPEYSSGLQPYSFVHVEDCAAILEKIGNREIYEKNLLTIPGPDCRTVAEYMKIIQQIVRPDVELHFGVKPDDGIRYSKELFSHNYLTEQIGCRYQYSFSEGIRAILTILGATDKE